MVEKPTVLQEMKALIINNDDCYEWLDDDYANSAYYDFNNKTVSFFHSDQFNFSTFDKLLCTGERNRSEGKKVCPVSIYFNLI